MVVDGFCERGWWCTIVRVEAPLDGGGIGSKMVFGRIIRVGWAVVDIIQMAYLAGGF